MWTVWPPGSAAWTSARAVRWSTGHSPSTRAATPVGARPAPLHCGRSAGCADRAVGLVARHHFGTLGRAGWQAVAAASGAALRPARTRRLAGAAGPVLDRRTRRRPDRSAGPPRVGARRFRRYLAQRNGLDVGGEPRPREGRE